MLKKYKVRTTTVSELQAEQTVKEIANFNNIPYLITYCLQCEESVRYWGLHTSKEKILDAQGLDDIWTYEWDLILFYY